MYSSVDDLFVTADAGLATSYPNTIEWSRMRSSSNAADGFDHAELAMEGGK